MGQENKYDRIVLKLSGAMFAARGGRGISSGVVDKLATDIKLVKNETGVQLAIVVGARNVYPGHEGHIPEFEDPTQIHFIGMMATIVNTLVLQGKLENLEMKTIGLSALYVEGALEHYERRQAINYLEEDYTLVLAAGTGHPRLSTDMAAALRAAELAAGLLVKASKVKGVYDDDPKSNPRAKFLKETSTSQMLDKALQIIDPSALAFCRTNNKPIVVFNGGNFHELSRIIRGEKVGTLITPD